MLSFILFLYFLLFITYYFLSLYTSYTRDGVYAVFRLDFKGFNQFQSFVARRKE